MDNQSTGPTAITVSACDLLTSKGLPSYLSEEMYTAKNEFLITAQLLFPLKYFHRQKTYVATKRRYVNFTGGTIRTVCHAMIGHKLHNKNVLYNKKKMETISKIEIRVFKKINL